MKITKIIFEEFDKKEKSLAVCSIIFEDSLKLNKIKLYKNKDKGFYLVLPSKQDVYQEIEGLNEGTEIVLPSKNSINKGYEEFFFPVESGLYKIMLSTVVECFPKFREKGVLVFKF